MSGLRAIVFCAAALSVVEESVYLSSKADVGKLPGGWTATKTGKGEGSTWQVVADDTAPSGSGYALAQTAESPNAVFNLCVVDSARFQNGTLSVAFKAVRGKNDQGGGLVWRFQDADNYYIARMNPLEDNFRVYKVVAGKRIQLGTHEDLKVAANSWHTLKVEQQGKQISCYFDGKKYLQVEDETFAAAGKIGLWTKSDAQTRFDKLIVNTN
jgi:3-keto-disaccharide hydrolase